MPPLFSFSGRIGRLSYLFGSLAVAIGSIVPALLLMGFVVALAATGPGLFLAIPLVLAFGVAMGWIGLALQVRRCRDIGWDPWVVLGGWMTMGAVDALVAYRVPSLALATDHHHHHGTAVGAVLNLAMWGALLLWPGRDGVDLSRPSGPLPRSRVEALRAEAGPVAAPAASASVAARPVTSPAGRVAFGRR